MKNSEIEKLNSLQMDLLKKIVQAVMQQCILEIVMIALMEKTYSNVTSSIKCTLVLLLIFAIKIISGNVQSNANGINQQYD